MPNCPRCGSPVSGTVCQNCGQNVSQVPVQPQQQMQPYPYQYQPVPPPQYIPPKDNSILPIIIVVVVVLVVILAIAGIFFMFLVADQGMIESTTTTPGVSMNWNEDPEEQGTYRGNVVSISGVSSIHTDDVVVTVTHGGQSGSRDLDEFEPPLQVGDLTLEFMDLEPTERLGPEDIFTITGGEIGDTIRLVYKPTSGQMVSSTMM
ncbi:MAG: hypothetical protein JSV09_07940 [Thermoplasmata archaeon]|nr:MAG: hypothetical protein JSV09_07940 [Thermoplasmata archaeon]